MTKAAPKDLTSAAEHYQFGENWADFVTQLSEQSIAEAEKGLAKLLHPDELVGRRFLDVGCGSGLHSLAALRLGAGRVEAIDIDPKSVETAHRLLSRYAPDMNWSVYVQSVLDLQPHPAFDIVYSWGVLHHTGAMQRAIRSAAAKVAPSGLLCVALYRETRLCWLWKIEKCLYSKGPLWLRKLLETCFIALMRRNYRRSGLAFDAFVSNYIKSRGMSFMTDIRDWLGGYPYELISEAAVRQLCNALGFEPVRTFCTPPGSGLLGNGCDEYVFRRR